MGEKKMDYEKTVLLLKMMANPIRLKILEALIEREKAECETCVSKLEEILKIPQSSVSQHLAHLRNSGVLSSMKKGKTVCYAINDETVMRILKCIMKG